MRISKVVPIAAAGFARLPQLAVLLVLPAVTPGPAGSVLVAAYGICVAVAILLDVGGPLFIVTRDGPVSVSSMTRILRMQAVAGLVSLGLATLVVLTAIPGVAALTPTELTVLAGLAVGQGLDTVLRVVKSPFVVTGQMTRYAVVDLCGGAARLAVVVAAFALDDLRWLLLVAVVHLVVLAIVTGSVRRILAASQSVVRRRDVLGVGLGGASSSFYSQSPLLCSAYFLDTSQLALLTVVLRFAQAVEFVPQTASLQLSRALRSRTSFVRPYLTLIVIGVGVASALALLWAVSTLFDGPTVTASTSLLLVAVVIKSGNYGLVIRLVSLDGSRYRLGLNAVVGLTVTLVAIVGASELGYLGAMIAITLGEAMLAWGILRTVRTGPIAKRG